jgi:antitoxin (DNA-binding transcriptional repressor) of toxin-antitoxin stability system
MRTVGTRELKQNPHAVIQDVLHSAEEVEITSHGHPTGVRLVPDRPTRARWVPASALRGLTPLEHRDAVELHALVEEGRADDVQDPWEPNA